MFKEVDCNGDYSPKNDVLYGVTVGMGGALVAAPFLGPLYHTQLGLSIQKAGIRRYFRTPSSGQFGVVMANESAKYVMSFLVADSIQKQFVQRGIFKDEQLCNVVSKFTSGFLLAPITSIFSTIQVKAFTDPHFNVRSVVKMFESYQSINAYVKGTGLVPNMFLQGINLSVLFGVGPSIGHYLHQSNTCHSKVLEDFLSGFIASQISILFGSPFARIATMQRTTPPGESISSMLSITKQIMQKEGAKGFTKGSGSATAMIHATNTMRTGLFLWLTESDRDKKPFFSSFSSKHPSDENLQRSNLHECPFSRTKP